MKPKNKIKRLKARIEAWEAIRVDGSSSSKKKQNHKPSGGILEYTKPGSFNR